MAHNHNLSALAFTQNFQKKADSSNNSLLIPTWRGYSINEGWRGQAQPCEGWPGTQHLHFTHPAGQAPVFSGHTPPAECRGPSGFPTLTAEAVKIGEFPATWKIFYCITKLHKMHKFLLTDDRIFTTVIPWGGDWRWSGLWEFGFLVDLGWFVGVGGVSFPSVFFLTPAFRKKEKKSSHKKLNVIWGRGGLTSPQTHAEKSTPNQKHREAYEKVKPSQAICEWLFQNLLSLSCKSNLNVKINVCEDPFCMEHIFQMFHFTTVFTEKKNSSPHNSQAAGIIAFS